MDVNTWMPFLKNQKLKKKKPGTFNNT